MAAPSGTNLRSKSHWYGKLLICPAERIAWTLVLWTAPPGPPFLAHFLARLFAAGLLAHSPVSPSTTLKP